MMETSEISNFYRDKYVFLTGATGFMGKLVIEKLLRSSSPALIYILVRPKKSLEPQARVKEMFEAKVFDRLKREVPDYLSRVQLVSGDIGSPGLGLSPGDCAMLTDRVNVVIHGAATVKFDEVLHLATKINVCGTIGVLKLCRQMKQLQVVIHTSTAYSNCIRSKVEEKFYPAPISAEKLINLTECLDEGQLEHILPYLLGEWPNTYVFTKAVAEDAVYTHGQGLPIAVFRPAIMISTRSEPVPGWIDNIYGPMGIIMGVGAGLIRTMRLSEDAKGDIVPADMTVNCLLAVGYKTALSTDHIDIPVYNYTSHVDNQISWKRWLVTLCDKGFQKPILKAVWYFSLTPVRSPLAYFFMALLLHTLPALFIDIGFVIVNRKPRALKIYKKIHKFVDVISYFALRSWDFANDNVYNLWKSLSPQDKSQFDFDMSALDWESYCDHMIDGLREHMFKEGPETIPAAKRRYFWFHIAHRMVQAVFLAGTAWCVYRLGSALIY